MKIIIAPSKTMKYQPTNIKQTKPIFLSKQDKLYQKLKQLSVEDIHDMMHISFNMSKKVYQYYHQENIIHPSLWMYSGTVFQQLSLSTYNNEALRYIDQHLRILSAYYGVLKHSDGISYYRLDMNMKLKNYNLYEFWKKEIKEYFKKEDYIINLASNEFFKMVSHPNIITIDFIEIIGDKKSRNATHVKMARGKMLEYMIQHQITSLDDLKNITFDDYHFDPSSSSNTTYVFSREARKQYIKR